MATLNQTVHQAPAPEGQSVRSGTDSAVAPPHTLRCLVVSIDASRRRMIRAAAEAEAWDAIMCRDAGEFLREAFKHAAPLLLVDLPPPDDLGYSALRDAAEHARQINAGLLAVSGRSGPPDEEVWARSLGAWVYVCQALRPEHFYPLFSDARHAAARRGAGPPPETSEIRERSRSPDAKRRS